MQLPLSGAKALTSRTPASHVILERATGFAQPTRIRSMPICSVSTKATTTSRGAANTGPRAELLEPIAGWFS